MVTSLTCSFFASAMIRSHAPNSRCPVRARAPRSNQRRTPIQQADLPPHFEVRRLGRRSGSCAAGTRQVCCGTRRATDSAPGELKRLDVMNESTMIPTALVAVGGALGSVARLKLGGLVLQTHADWRFPIGTFVVNVLGCLVIGALAALSERSSLISPNARIFLFTGILGGFTTFSAFGLETFHLLRRGELLVAGSYAGLSVVVGLLALWLGFAFTASAAR